MTADFGVRLVFLSDWLIGTGEGRLAAVDAVVRRDADGLPFVPAKTLIGVWRDACETVAAALDGAPNAPGAPGGGAGGAWAAWVDWLFGSQPARRGDRRAAGNLAPVPAALSLAPARAPRGLRAAVRDKPALLEAAVLVRPGVALDANSGTAREKFLRLEERALRGTELRADAHVATDGAGVPAAAELLLRGGARLVDAVGGKRNRGAGRVAILLLDAPAPLGDECPPQELPADGRLVELLNDPLLLADPGVPPAVAATAAPLQPGARAGGRHTVRLELQVITPVVVVDRVLGNIVTTRGEITGTVMLPALLPHLRRDGGLGLADLRIGDAVPAVRADDGGLVPALPVPASWHRTKKGQGPVVINAATTRLDAGDQPKPVRGRVARLGSDRWRQVEAAEAISTHAVVDDEARRPTTTGGGVFTYLGLEPGTLLVSDVVIPADATLHLQAGATLRLGRSRKDDFGQVRVIGVRELPTPVGEPAPTNHDGDGGRLLRVWCVSDVLLHDERLAPDPSPHRLAAVLAAALGMTDGAVKAVAVTGEDERRPTVVEATRRDGFARRWGRPRRTQVALRAGSVVTLRLAEGARINPARVIDVERDGVGDRTTEGFGRLLLNPPELRVDKPAVERGTPPGTATATHSDKEAPGWVPPTTPHPLELAAWRRQIRRRAAERTTDAARREEIIPGLARLPRAQLGGLRSQLERLALPSGNAAVAEWFDAITAVKRRETQWGEALPRARALLLDDPGLVWRLLGLDDAQDRLVLTPGREELLRDRLRWEARAVLVEELLRQLRAEQETSDLETTERDTVDAGGRP
ncbi:MAG: hypothetical protein HYR62_07525 [Actinobacteria bacterium]|nr:hypothetical protein [Actinomycetota bacterium]MBI3686167.1 hypothetical protein [Actinomycetota bacterium]